MACLQREATKIIVSLISSTSLFCFEMVLLFFTLNNNNKNYISEEMKQVLKLFLSKSQDL